MDPPNAVPANAFVKLPFQAPLRTARLSFSIAGCRVPINPTCLMMMRPRKLSQENDLPNVFHPNFHLGNLSLHLTLGNKIGRGRVGRVYEATVDLTKSSPELSNMVLPPLVVKISRRHDAKRLAREAYYYEEMECLQGCVIPRYYGLYQTVIQPSMEFLPWAHDKVNRSPGCHGDYSDKDDSDPGSESDSESDCDDDSDKDKDDEDSEDSEVYSSDEEELPTPTMVSILILERVGGRLPLGKPLPAGIQGTLEALYADLAQLGVDHCDIRYYNILQAPGPDNPLPSLPSPFTQRIHRWRLISFDEACKSNMSPMVFYGYHHDLLARLVYNLPWGEIYEPWD
ncbi:unnamed protein product [Somion occarium]|uniref:Protein kinase domain-containing protein n=1 Tax=Somion occarium TaxID=3059160 RepID=A0ABP1DH42_9APHY